MVRHMALRVGNRLQILPLILNEFKRLNSLLFPLKSSENLQFSNNFRGNRSKLIRLT